MHLVGFIIRIYYTVLKTVHFSLNWARLIHSTSSHRIPSCTNFTWRTETDLLCRKFGRFQFQWRVSRAVDVSQCFHYLPLIKLVITGTMREVNEERGAMLWLGTVNFMNVFGTASGIPSKYYMLRTNRILMSEHLERRNLISSGASFLVWQTLGARLW